ncbi:MAG: peptidoglycan DD-metalloendopeptidase family protein [Oleispira sp.]|nr:peptidoglycan DD-metalloendopeptidase family protein [Oleispira sp.]MBL4880713.1 peptidoglycan DD-metalloendopeptidase family protein [Oleispira sp.]
MLRIIFLFSFVFCQLTQVSWADEQADLEKLQQEINKLQLWLKNTESEHDKLNQQLRLSDERIGALAKKIDDTRNQLNEERARLKKLQAEQSQLRVLKSEQKQQLAKQLIGAQKIGNQGSIKVLLNQDDPQQVSRMLKYYEYFNQARMESIQTLIINLKRLNNIENEILTQQNKLIKTENSLLKKNKQLNNDKRQHKKLLASLEKRRQQKSSDLSQKQKDQKRLQQLITEVATLLVNSVRKQDARPIRSLKGKLPRPTKGRIVKAFGNYNAQARSKWQGWLIKGYEGSPITSIHHGRIVFSDWLRGFGLLLIVDHGDGYLSLYARNQSLLKSVGDWVYQGENIATLGSSGGFKEPRLYFEIRYKGKPQDPASWLSR